MIHFPIVISARRPDPAASELATAAHCLRLHVTREQGFLAALAPHVPDELLFQWRTLFYEAEFSRQWLEQLDTETAAA